MTTELTWTGSPDDQTAKVGKYTLRAEYRGYGWYLSTVFFKSKEIKTDESANNIEEAKAAAIAAMNEHLKEK